MKTAGKKFQAECFCNSADGIDFYFFPIFFLLHLQLLDRVRPTHATYYALFVRLRKK